MEVNRKELQTALKIVKPGLANKDVVEQATSFAFITGKVVTYNDEISVSHPITGIDIEGAIRADKLYAFLDKLNKDTVDITMKGSELVITCGRAKAGLPLQSEIKLPLEEEIAQIGKWKSLPEHFCRLVKMALPSCSKDMSRPVLTCVHIAHNGFIEASDNYRITQCDMKAEMPVKDFLIPASSASQVVKMDPLPIEIAEGKGWIHFRNELGTIMSCRIIAEAYPNISKFLKVDGKRLTLPKTIESVLNRASVFYERDHDLDEIVYISLKENRLKVQAESRAGETIGWFKEEVNIEYEDEPFTFAITPYLLTNIFKETGGCTLGDNRLRFEGEGWVYITLLRENM